MQRASPGMEAAKSDERHDPTENLSKKFRSTAAVSDVNLAVPEGAIYALVGANGAGKTTLIKLLMKIFRPTAGGARVMGIDCRHLAGKDFQHIGYVSENQEMPEWMTVETMLDYVRPFYPQWDGRSNGNSWAIRSSP